MDVDLVRLRYFATVAQHLHFGRAAQALHVARPALSRAILELESELGVELFVRPSEQTELTEAGHALLERALAALAEQDRAQAQADAYADRDAPTRRGGSGPVFTVAIMPGVTVSKWSTVWAQRRPDLPLRVLRTDAQTQISVLRDGSADVSFVRLPVEQLGLSTIGLYAEVPVVVLPVDHELTLLESVSVVDLVEEHLLQDPDEVPAWRDAALRLRTAERRPLPAMASIADTIALVAAGLGVVIVPQSVARLHHRKDLTYRPVTDAEEHRVAVAWLEERTTADVEEFIGVVRGRSVRSSRSPSAEQPKASAPSTAARSRAAVAKPGRAASPARQRSNPKSRRPRGTR